MFNNASSEVIIVFHTYCSIIGRYIIRRSINCHIYVLTHLFIIVSLFCLSVFCLTSCDSCTDCFHTLAMSINDDVR